MYILNDLTKWESLRLLHQDKGKYHYKTIQDKFKQWSDLNVFKIAHNKLLSENIFNNITSNTTLNLFIDSADIDNVNGSELTGYGKNKKKKQTKLSVICDENKTDKIKFRMANLTAGICNFLQLYFPN